MRAIQADVVLTSASTRADNSLGLRFATAELSPSEKTAFFELLQKPLKCILHPISDPVDSIIEVKAPLGMKSASQRLRSVLYVLWSQQRPEDTGFETFYQQKMDHVIDKFKALLAPE